EAANTASRRTKRSFSDSAWAINPSYSSRITWRSTESLFKGTTSCKSRPAAARVRGCKATGKFSWKMTQYVRRKRGRSMSSADHQRSAETDAQRPDAKNAAGVAQE